MSRATVENKGWQMAFGVDHALGAFFQIWEKRAKGEDPEGDAVDQPQISASEQFGFAINNPNTMRDKELANAINMFKDDVRFLREPECIITIAKALNFDIKKEVYKLWD